MGKEKLKQALISIVVGSAIVAVANILQGLADLLLEYKDQTIPAATGMVHYLRTWKPTA